MLTPLSILSLDQGPKWREPEPATPAEARPQQRRTPVRALLAALAALFGPVRKPAASR
jgi:hypothetical protein